MVVMGCDGGVGWWEMCLPPLGLLGGDRSQEPGVIRRYTEDEDLLLVLLRDRLRALRDPAWRRRCGGSLGGRVPLERRWA